jgi:hypothetical protein
MRIKVAVKIRMVLSQLRWLPLLVDLGPRLSSGKDTDKVVQEIVLPIVSLYGHI